MSDSAKFGVSPRRDADLLGVIGRVPMRTRVGSPSEVASSNSVSRLGAFMGIRWTAWGQVHRRRGGGRVCFGSRHFSTAIAGSLARPVAGVPMVPLPCPWSPGSPWPVSWRPRAAFGSPFQSGLTLGLAVNGRFRWAYVTPYLAAQFLGSIVAASSPGASMATGPGPRHLGATYPANGVGVGRAILAEVIVTFLLVWVVVLVASTRCFGRLVRHRDRVRLGGRNLYQLGRSAVER